MTLFSLYSWRRFLLNIEFWVDRFCFTVLCPPSFLIRNLLSFILLFIYVSLKFHFSPAAFKNFSFSFVFSSLIMMCYHMIFFESILFGFPQPSWICKFISFIKFGKLLAIISSNIFMHLSVSPILQNSIGINARIFYIVPQILEILFIFPPNCSLFVLQIEYILLIYFQAHWLSFSSLFCC